MNIKEENTKQLKIMCENFKTLRKSKGWSIEELSEISGIDKKILTDIEDDKDFDAIYFIELCRVYKIKPHKMFSRIINQQKY